MADTWRAIESDIVACERCPRLRAHCLEVARVKRRAYRDQTYWGLPVPGFGDRRARIVLVGLAPAAHGANRTGRMFTGDRSGDWLFAALHRAGLANRPESVSRSDGLKLSGAFITAACRCAPPGNRPTPEEQVNCSIFFDRELDRLRDLRVAIALGAIGWETLTRRARRVDAVSVPRPKPVFGHGAETTLGLHAAAAPVVVVGCYHPSQQNTQTGRLTRPMIDRVLRRAVRLAGLQR
jgi:uracil-DNA glycosylase family 4